MMIVLVVRWRVDAETIEVSTTLQARGGSISLNAEQSLQLLAGGQLDVSGTSVDFHPGVARRGGWRGYQSGERTE